jgi:DNA helicase-2/ATP-dependent DNA helicase PcrA
MMVEIRWNDGLSPEQEAVAKHTGVYGRLLAGPGTGKTRTMTSRAAYLVEEQHVSANEVLALTFTRAAASELKNRVAALLGGQAAPQVSTLHSFALRSILRAGAGDRLPSPIRIADDYEERWIIEEDIKRILNLDRVDQARDLVERLSADWETLAADAHDWEQRFPDPEFLGAWKEHRAIYGYTLRAELVYQLKRALEEGAIELSNSPKYVLVDEYQDLNSCDLSIIRSLARSGAELYVAGDDDQSIYGFRYADPGGIRRFITEYDGAADLRLTECYRCGQDILTIAQFVAAQDTRRIEKPLVPYRDSSPGEVHLLRFEDYDKEALGIAAITRWLVNIKRIPVDRILVLVRSDRYQKFSDPIRVAFEAEELPAARVEDPLVVLESRDGRIFLSLLRLMTHSTDSLAWRDLIEHRDNHLGMQAVSSIYEVARSRGTTFYEALPLIVETPSLIPRQGWQIKSEYEEISEGLYRLREEYGHTEDLSDFTGWMLGEFLTVEGANDILKVIHDVISENDISSIEDLVQSLTTPIRDAEQVRVEGRVNIMTMHQAKGLDADAVFIIAAEDEYIPGRAEGSSIDDERRLLYVSLTRARSYLYITHCTRRTGGQKHTGRNSGSETRTLTRFLSGGPLVSIPADEYLHHLQ